MKNLTRIFAALLCTFMSIHYANANGDDVLGQVVRLSKQGLNYTTATVKVGQRFSPIGVPQPATLTIYHWWYT